MRMPRTKAGWQRRIEVSGRKRVEEMREQMKERLKPGHFFIVDDPEMEWIIAYVDRLIKRRGGDINHPGREMVQSFRDVLAEWHDQRRNSGECWLPMYDFRPGDKEAKDFLAYIKKLGG